MFNYLVSKLFISNGIVLVSLYEFHRYCFIFGLMKFKFLMFACLIFGVLDAQNNYTQFLNPFVGTGGHGHTFPGATLPFAMVQLSPDTRIDGSWDGCSGYHYSDSVIYGFSHTHLSGTGCSDYGDIAFMPSESYPPVHNLQASFRHENENAEPGFYSVKLNNGIQVELTATTRVGLQKYTSSRRGKFWIILNLKHRDQLLEGKITQVTPTVFEGLRRSKAWAENQLVFYRTELSKSPANVTITQEAMGQTTLVLEFDVKKGEVILIKTALSSVNEEGAARNLKAELKDWDFKKTRENASKLWNDELKKIKAFGGSKDEKKTFYTALYHCMMHPNVLNDVDGRYRGRDNEIHQTDGFNYYTVFSLWDTHRALHPLLNIIDKKRSLDFIKTFKAQYEQSGRLPMWELWGNETNCMIGFHGVSVIANAYAAGVIDRTMLVSLYPAVYSEAMNNRFGLDKFRNRGYLSIEDEHESVSKTLEYAFNMKCAGIIAANVGRSIDAEYFNSLAKAWLEVMDFRTGFVTPRSNGGWLPDFDPRQVNNHFTEANAWQYSFKYNKPLSNAGLLSQLFNTSSITSGREQVDITGLIGQYAHGNEPSHHVAYLFDQRDSVNKYVSEICRRFYSPNPDGLCGNDDCGQMSAWYVFSAMGIYPSDPSTAELTIGNMLFDSVEINMNNTYNVKLRRTELSQNAFTVNYANGGLQVFPKLSIHRPNEMRMEKSESGIFKFCEEYGAIPSPVIQYDNFVFSDSLWVSIVLNLPADLLASVSDFRIVYTLNGSEPDEKSQSIAPGSRLRINQSCVLKAAVLYRVLNQKNELSKVSQAEFYRFSNHYNIQLFCEYNQQYTAGGDRGLLDGLRGDADWRKGRWQGYQGQNFEAVIDMKEVKEIREVKAGFLQDTRSWILFPQEMQVMGSTDGIHYETIGSFRSQVPDTMMTSTRMDHTVNGNGRSYRYIKVVAVNYGKLPAWHPGAGGNTFIFVDEITIRSKD